MITEGLRIRIVGKVDALGCLGMNTVAVVHHEESIHDRCHSGGYAGRNWIA